MMRQITIFDWMPSVQPEPEIGEIVHGHGQIICHIMRPSYIGKKVCFDVSTENNRNCFRVGILERIVPALYYNRDDKPVETDISIIFTGKRQRSYITHMPGREIYECLPWDAYPERMKGIGRQ